MHFSHIIIFLLVSCFTYGQSKDNLINEVDKLIEFNYELDFEEKEGLWVGVIDEDSTFIFSIGNIDQDSLSNFQIGSISKIFTGKLLQESLKNNKANPEDKVIDFLALHPNYNKITIKQLLNHQSGLPKDPYFFGKHNKNPDNPYESYPDELIIPQLNQYSNYYHVNQANDFNYGHLNYALLGLLLEGLEEKTYCKLIEEGYGSKYQSIQCSEQSRVLTEGYSKTGQLGQPWTFPGFEASEGLSMNIVDLVNFIRSEFEVKAKDEAIEISKHLSFEAPWYILSQKRNRKIHSFSGTTSIHSVFVCYNKENKTAVVMMRNSGKGILNLPLDILSMVDDSRRKNK